MWMTGFDVECLSTLYIDKPMKAHTLMQAIARANRVYPGKDFGLIVDYNGMLKSLREALAQYALGDDGDGGAEIIAPIEERVQAALVEGIEAAEAHLRRLGFDLATLVGSTGFVRIRGLKDGVEAVYSSDEAKRRFEILARQVFVRFKALLMEPSAFVYTERHDNIEAIYKKLGERRDTADVTDLLKELHRIVNEVIRTQAPGDDQAEALTFDLSQIDMEKLRDEFAKKVQHKATALQDIREIVEQKLAEMLARNPRRMDYQQKYEEIVADYNREKDRTIIEETFRRLTELMEELDAEQKRAVAEGLNEDELALFDLLRKESLAKAERERVKQASRSLLGSIKARLSELDRFWEKGADQGRRRGLHTRRDLRQPADAAVHRRGEGRRLRTRSMSMSCNRPSAVSLRGQRDEQKAIVLLKSAIRTSTTLLGGPPPAAAPDQFGFVQNEERVGVTDRFRIPSRQPRSSTIRHPKMSSTNTSPFTKPWPDSSPRRSLPHRTSWATTRNSAPCGRPLIKN